MIFFQFLARKKQVIKVVTTKNIKEDFLSWRITSTRLAWKGQSIHLVWVSGLECLPLLVGLSFDLPPWIHLKLILVFLYFSINGLSTSSETGDLIGSKWTCFFLFVNTIYLVNGLSVSEEGSRHCMLWLGRFG